MDTRRFSEVSALHLEPDTYAHLLQVAATGPGRPGGARYDADDPWHNLIVEPHTYGCWVHIGVVEDGLDGTLPASLAAILREAHESGATYVLFDADLSPMLDLPVFEHPDPPIAAEPRRVVFSYSVPVHVEVEDGQVTAVTVIDETPVSEPKLVEGDPEYLTAAVAAANDGQSWPSWSFGH